MPFLITTHEIIDNQDVPLLQYDALSRVYKNASRISPRNAPHRDSTKSQIAGLCV